MSVPGVLKKELSVPKTLKRDISIPEFLTRDVTFSDLFGGEPRRSGKPGHVACEFSPMVDEMECPHCGCPTPSNIDRCVGCGTLIMAEEEVVVERSFYGESRSLADYDW